MLTCLKLYDNADAGVTADGIATIDVPADGSIECIEWIVIGIDAAIQAVVFELSLASSSGFTTNDTRAAISQVAIANTAAAAGVVVNKHTHFTDPIKVEGGERLHIHLLNVGAGAFDTLRVSCFVYCKLAGTGAGRTRRL